MLAAITPQTRVAVLDHVTSITGLVLPIARLVEEIERKRGIPVLVDGAHGPGMVPLDLRQLGAPCPPSMIGSLAAIALPALQRPPPPSTCGFIDPLGDWLLTEAGVEVPVQPFPRAGCRTLRISAAPYNTMADYERLADAVAPWLPGA